jgi:hypothetical protein
MEPRDLALQAEDASLPEGTEERFNGWGIMGLPFRSGHVLALRRFPANSIGPAYSSVWHRSPGGDWTFHGDTPPMQSCTRYFGSAVKDSVSRPISIEWTSARSVTIAVADEGLELTAELASTPVTTAMNALGSVLPDAAWRNAVVLSVMASVAGLALAAGKMRIKGQTPNGQWFIVNPRRIWMIPRAEASLKGQTFGPVGALEEQAQLGDFAIPQRGIFAIGRAFFEPFDETRHLTAASRP